MSEMTVEEAFDVMKEMAVASQWKGIDEAVRVALAELSRLRAENAALTKRVGELEALRSRPEPSPYFGAYDRPPSDIDPIPPHLRGERPF